MLELDHTDRLDCWSLRLDGAEVATVNAPGDQGRASLRVGDWAWEIALIQHPWRIVLWHSDTGTGAAWLERSGTLTSWLRDRALRRTIRIVIPEYDDGPLQVKSGLIREPILVDHDGVAVAEFVSTDATRSGHGVLPLRVELSLRSDLDRFAAAVVVVVVHFLADSLTGGPGAWRAQDDILGGDVASGWFDV